MDRATYEEMIKVIQAYERIVYGHSPRRVSYDDFLRRPAWQRPFVLNTISVNYTRAINSRVLTRAPNPQLEN